MGQTYSKEQRLSKNEKRKQLYWNNREKELLINSNSTKKRKYGLDLKEYFLILDEQGGVCAICGEPETDTNKGKIKNLAVDHDKRFPGTHRGLLCSKCNRGLGLFRDNLKFLENAIIYLKVWGEVK